MKRFIGAYNGEVDRYKRERSEQSLDDFVRYDHVIWDDDLKKDLRRGRYAVFCEQNVRRCLYRPFTKKHIFFDRLLNARVYVFPHVMPLTLCEEENRFIAVSQIGYRAKQFSCLIANLIGDLHLCASLDGHQCFPFYVYDEDGGNRRENITDWALTQFRDHYGDTSQSDESAASPRREPRASGQGEKLDPPPLAGAAGSEEIAKRRPPLAGAAGSEEIAKRRPPLAGAAGSDEITKWDIFHYVYGVLHHPGYREKFADNLKRELPRIPFAPDFWEFAKAGEELARLHLDYEKLEPYPLKWVETPGVPLSYRVEDKMRLSKDKTSLVVNPSLTLAGIPAETLQYRLGNRSALDWVIDQYQVSKDKRSGIESDPNRADDPEYIVRLVGQVVRVSLETVRIVRALPAEYCP